MKLYILCDLVLWGSLGLISPIFAVFINDQIKGGDVKVVGFAAAIYLIAQSIPKIPIGLYLDKNHGEKDDFYFMFFGAILIGLIYFAYIFIYLPWHVYLLQFLHGLIMAGYLPASWAIWIRHIDKGQEAFQSSVDSTAVGIGAGITGALGGILAATIGFRWIFFMVGIFSLLAAFVIALMKPGLFLENGKSKEIHQIKKLF